MNSLRDIDAFLDAVNVRLTGDGVFICCVETMEQRARRLRSFLTPPVYYLILPFDFLIRRVIPRLRITRGLWQFFTGGANPPLSRAEALGRLCRAGFSIKQEKFAGNMLCIKAERRSVPLLCQRQRLRTDHRPSADRTKRKGVYRLQAAHNAPLFGVHPGLCL